MSYKPTAEEMAGDLPVKAGTGTGPKSQLLLVAEILKQFTDENNGLTADEIRKVIEIRTGRKPTAAKVRDDIHALADCGLFGMEVAVPSRGESGGFRCKRTFLSSEQTRLVINMVRTCKFVTKEQRDNLCEALFSMVSYHQQDRIAGSVVVDKRELPQTPDVFTAAEVFSQAMEAKPMRKVSFRYVARGFNEEEQWSLNYRDGSTVIEETPISLVYSFGNYYAETWSGTPDDGIMMVRRLDRVRDAFVSDNEAVTSDLIDTLRDTVQERVSQTFDMLGSGETRDIFLKVEPSAARYVYDRFGHGTKFEYIEPDGSYGYAHVAVKLSPTFYRWLFGMGDRISIAEPQAIWETRFRSDGSKLVKPHDTLIDDYAIAMKGLRDQINKVANAYGWETIS